MPKIMVGTSMMTYLVVFLQEYVEQMRWSAFDGENLFHFKMDD